MRFYRLEMPGEPKAQARWGSKGVYVNTAWRSTLTALALLSPGRPRKKLTGPLGIYLRFTFTRPASRPDDTWKDTVPDNDNLEKSTWDALQKAGWFNDASIARNLTDVVFGDSGHVQILVWELPQSGVDTVVSLNVQPWAV